MTDFRHLPPAPLWRRLVAAIYDWLLIAALWFVTTGIIITLFNHYQLGLENYHGVGKPSDSFLHWVLLPLLLLEAWIFYAWFWLHGGQTLGMRSWCLQVADYRGRPMKLWQTLVRFAAAFPAFFLAGAGYLLVLIKPHQSLHDRLSATETRVVPKPR